MVALTFQSKNAIWISDPEIAKDIFMSKNAYLDKTLESYLMFKGIIG